MVVLLDTVCVFTCVWGPLKLISGRMLVGLLTETSWRQHSELPVQLTWILCSCCFFRLLPKTLDFADSFFQPCAKYYSTPPLSAKSQSCGSACHYSQLQISLHTLWFTDAEVVVYGLCLCGKEIFEKLSWKKNSSLFSAKDVLKIKIIFIKAGHSYMKILKAFTPLMESSR